MCEEKVCEEKVWWEVVCEYEGGGYRGKSEGRHSSKGERDRVDIVNTVNMTTTMTTRRRQRRCCPL